MNDAPTKPVVATVPVPEKSPWQYWRDYLEWAGIQFGHSYVATLMAQYTTITFTTDECDPSYENGISIADHKTQIFDSGDDEPQDNQIGREDDIEAYEQRLVHLALNATAGKSKSHIVFDDDMDVAGSTIPESVAVIPSLLEPYSNWCAFGCCIFIQINCNCL